MSGSCAVIDDLGNAAPMATIGTRWQLITDQVMGGISQGRMERTVTADRVAIRMCGEVRLEHNGGFVQMALDLATGGRTFDASDWHGIEVDMCGDDQAYGVHLRTADLTLPWQSYRQHFRVSRQWTTLRLPFVDFACHRTGVPIDLRRLRRLGVVAIGRAFSFDLSVGGVRFFRANIGQAEHSGG